ncbi:MAG: hypothetical protein Q7N50_03975 [Armatimonadota bacterium]|nr:hypothetical protein [Armatimonadota bacterium]
MNDNKMAKWLFIVSGAVVALAIFVSIWVQKANTIPTIHIPTPKMPSPNAYDSYIAAANAIQEADKIGYAISEYTYPAQPAGSPPTLERNYSLAEKEAIIHKNAKALSALRQGFNYEYLNPPVRSFSAICPHFSRFREMARLLVLEAQVKAGQGDWGGSMESRLDAIRMGQDIPRGGGLISMLVGVAIQSIGRKGAWKVVDKLDIGETQGAILQMEDILARQLPFADTIQEEKWSGQAGLIELFQQPGWRSSMGAYIGSGSTSSTAPILDSIRSLTWSKGKALRAYTTYMDQYIKTCRMPYPAMAKGSPKIPNEPICRMILPVLDKERYAGLKAETQNTLFTVTLALHAYHLEHGRYPAALAELTSSYLKKIPNDPFALKKPLKYKQVGAKYVLYSIGPDAKDNGGKPIYDKSQAPGPGAPPSQQQRPYTMLPESKGDLVAGVNIL